MPKPQKKPREGSRLQVLKENGLYPHLPDVTCSYLLEYLYEIGPTQAGGFGPTPLTHQEILAWQVNMRRFLQPWEILMLRRLSIEWCNQAALSEDETCPAPYEPLEVSKEHLNVVARNMRDALRAMAR